MYNIYFYLFIIGGGISLLMIILTLSGMDGFFEDFDIDSDSDADFLKFSIKEIFASLMGFGGAGIISVNEFGMGKSSLLVAISGAVLVGYLFKLAFKKIKKLEKQRVVSITDFVGSSGVVETTCTHHESGTITITNEMGVQTFRAFSNSSDVIIPKGHLVEVVDTDYEFGMSYLIVKQKG